VKFSEFRLTCFGTVSDHRFVTKFINFEINYLKIFEVLAVAKPKGFLKNLAKIEKLQ